MYRIIIILLSLLLLFSACSQTPNNETIENDESDGMTSTEFIEYSEQSNQEKEVPDNIFLENGLDFIIAEPIIMAESGRVTLKNGESIYVELKMLNGRYDTSISDAIFSRRWKGDFELHIYSDYNNLVATYPVLTVGYDRYFRILVDDYNQDGNPDFVLAISSVVSRMKSYRMYTIDESYEIHELPFGDGENGFEVHSTADSIRLIIEDEHIVLYMLPDDDPLDPSTLRASYYEWDGSMFAYLETVEVLGADIPWEEHNTLFQQKSALMYE